tara:strand:+ start:397 stop:1377 length:981 start_codon:yes stop_codon:yes gene_type:complete
MPGLIGSQGVRPGALNMGRIFRALRYRTEQAKYAVYHRPAIFKTDIYGVPTNTDGSDELLLPNLPVIIRPSITADYQQARAGNNIIGAARIYTPNITTIKSDTGGIGEGNFEQTITNPSFNEIEGWDRFITNYRSIFNIPTSDNTNWSADAGTITSDGESITNTLTSNGYLLYTATTKNVLEADRFRFKIKTNFTMTLTSFKLTNIIPKTLTYTPTTLSIPSGEWLTIDVPFISGTTTSSIYRDGTRHAVTVVGEAGWDYEDNMNTIQLNYTGQGALTDTIQITEVEFYKSISWHVHSLKDMTDGYLIFNCIRTVGRDDAKRRAYE